MSLPIILAEVADITHPETAEVPIQEDRVTVIQTHVQVIDIILEIIVAGVINLHLHPRDHILLVQGEDLQV